MEFISGTTVLGTATIGLRRRGDVHHVERWPVGQYTVYAVFVPTGTSDDEPDFTSAYSSNGERWWHSGHCRLTAMHVE